MIPVYFECFPQAREPSYNLLQIFALPINYAHDAWNVRACMQQVVLQNVPTPM